MNGEAKFLLFASYFDAMRSVGLNQDLAYLKSVGIDGIRIYPNWWHYVCSTQGRLGPALDDGLFTANGALRESAWAVFQQVLDAAVANELLVDVTFTRETITGQASGVSVASYSGQIAEVARRLSGAYPNVFFDIQNEFNHNGLDEDAIPGILAAVRAEDPAPGSRRLVTVSTGSGSTEPQDAGEIAASAGLDLVGVHPPRDEDWHTSGVVQASVADVVAGLGGLQKPIYFQEPKPVSRLPGCTTGDYYPVPGHAGQAAATAKEHGVAAWTFHTRTNFVMTSSGYRSLLDEYTGERAELESLRGAVDAAAWGRN